MGYLIGGLVAAAGVLMVVAGMTHSGASLFETVTGKAPAPQLTGTSTQAAQLLSVGTTAQTHPALVQ